jgi:hypothetical protein
VSGTSHWGEPVPGGSAVGFYWIILFINQKGVCYEKFFPALSGNCRRCFPHGWLCLPKTSGTVSATGGTTGA